jgi:putative peptidoglycan lipid II flippase
MVQRILRLFHKEISGLHEAAYLVGISSIASQLLALLRDRLLAHTFGAGTELDIYYAAFRIPDFIYVSIASFVSVTVLIPFLMERTKSGDTAEGREFLNSVLTVFLAVMAVVSIVIFLLIPYLTKVVAPGFDPDSREKLILLTRILLLSPLFLGISNLVGSVTQSLHRFFVYAVSPIVYNLGIIAGILVFYPLAGLPGLVYGVVFGALLHLLVQVPTLCKSGFAPRLTFKVNWREIRDVVTLSFPRTLGLSFSQLATMALVAFASLVGKGAISIFNFSYNLQSVPLSIIGVSYSVAAFPTLSRLFSRGERERFVEHIISATRHIIFWSVPVLTLFIVLRAQIVRTILGSGRFNWTDTRLTAAALALFCISLFAQSIVLLLVRGYYAAGNTRIPLLRNFLSSLLIVIVAFWGINFYHSNVAVQQFVGSFLRLDNVEGGAVVFLPLAYSLGMMLDAIVLWWNFKKDFCENKVTIARRTFFQSVFSSVVMGIFAYVTLGALENLLNTRTFLGIFLQGFFAGGVGIIAGVLVLHFLKNEELGEIRRYLHLKFWKVRPIAQSPEEL